MVGVQVAKEFDGRVYIGEVIASVPPEEGEEPATLAATRAPVAAGGGGSGGSVGGGGGGAGLDAPGDILLTPPRVRPRASSGGGGSGASASHSLAWTALVLKNSGSAALAHLGNFSTNS